MPVIPYLRRGHSHPIPHTQQPAEQHTAKPAQPFSTSVLERETCTSRVSGQAGQPLQAKHIPPAASVQAQDMLHCPTHPTANHSPAPGQGQEPQKEALEESDHSELRTGHPANPTPKPLSCPRTPATHPPAQHTSRDRTGWPSPSP
ncbi:hypothetical protein CRENBAI_013631, partial [Crenichthys baileyi]